MALFDGCLFVLDLDDQLQQKQLINQLQKHGGNISDSVTDCTAGLITTENKMTIKYKKFEKALNLEIPVVTPIFIRECIFREWSIDSKTLMLYDGTGRFHQKIEEMQNSVVPHMITTIKNFIYIACSVFAKNNRDVSQAANNVMEFLDDQYFFTLDRNKFLKKEQEHYLSEEESLIEPYVGDGFLAFKNALTINPSLTSLKLFDVCQFEPSNIITEKLDINYGLQNLYIKGLFPDWQLLVSICTNIKTLYISSNYKYKQKFSLKPLQALKGLELLSLKKCEMSEDFETLSCQLTCLYLEECLEIKMDSLIRYINSNTSLKELSLMDIDYEGEIKYDHFASALSNNTTLTSLSLNHKDYDSPLILEALQNNVTLKKLHIYNFIGNPPSEVLQIVLKNSNIMDLRIKSYEENIIVLDKFQYITLTSLDLQKNLLGKEAWDLIEHGLSKNVYLLNFNLSGTGAGDYGTCQIAKALKSNTTLVTLNLDENNISKDGASYLADGLAGNVSLQILTLKGNHISIKGAANLSESFKTNRYLTSLDLSENHIGDRGAKFISNGLKNNNSLTTLNLSSNGIAEAGTILLLNSNTTLTNLNINSNCLGPYISNEVANKITHSWIKEINFGNNAISDIRELCIALERNTKLTTLILSDNLIDVQGAFYLSSVFETNNTLCNLDLKGNSIGIMGVAHLSSTLRNNTSLTCLELEGIEINDESMDYLADALISNTSLISLGLQFHHSHIYYI